MLRPPAKALIAKRKHEHKQEQETPGQLDSGGFLLWAVLPAKDLDIAGGQPALFEVLLVIVLGKVEVRGGSDLGDNGSPVPAATSS